MEDSYFQVGGSLRDFCGHKQEYRHRGRADNTHSSFERGAVDRECRPNGGWECEAVHKLITLAADRVHVLTWGCSKLTADRVHVHT